MNKQQNLNTTEILNQLMILQSQKETIELLKKYNVPVTESKIFDSKKDAINSKQDFPIVLKIISSDIIHKTDAGGIKTDIKNKKELKIEINNMELRVKKKFPKAKLQFMIQKQESGKEVIIGMKRDEQFGPVILFGLGGVLVEIFKDVSMRIAPITMSDINEMVDEIKAAKLLTGYRGEKAVDIKSLKNILLNISKLSLKEKNIVEIDFNPVIVNEKYATVVDARILTK